MLWRIAYIDIAYVRVRMKANIKRTESHSMKKVLIVLLAVSVATNIAFIGNYWLVAPQEGAACDAAAVHDVDKVVRFLHDARVCYVATIDGAHARVRPFGAAMAIDGKLSIGTGRKKNVFRQMKEQPNVEISAMVGDGKSIRISGALEDRTSPESRRRFFKAFPSLAEMYGGKEDQFAVLSFARATAVISDSSGYEETIELK